MPFYYDIERAITTNSTAAALSTHLRMLTVANQMTCRITALYGKARFGTAGGAFLQLVTAATAGTGGTAQTPQPRNSKMPAADTTVFNDATAITVGGTPTTRATCGFAQTGGQNGWVATEFDNAVTLRANGGANGNAEVGSIANASSVTGTVTLEFAET
jgi:hypothetical protein